MHKHYKTVAAIAASSLLAAFAAQANKGADYEKPHHKHEHHKKFTLTGGATYLEPSFNGLDFFDSVSPIVGGGDAVQTENLEQKFNWGYFLGAAYQISHHYDVQLTWAQINTSNDDSDSMTGGTGKGIITSNREFFSLGATDTATADARETLDYQVLDATLGQYHNITEMLKTRLFAGVRYAKITDDTDITYIVTGRTINPFDNYDSSFSGVGPEAGLDLEYKIWDKLGVVGSLAAAFLVGNQDSSSDVFATNGFQNTVDSDDNIRMVPALNAKLGANWEIPYRLHNWGFGVEAGYQVAYYFNVVDQIQYQPTTGSDVQHNYSNVGFMGPYLNFSAAF